MSETAELRHFFRTAFGQEADAVSHHALRAFVLERATGLEYAMNDVLAARLAATANAADELAFDVYSRIGIDTRVQMIASVLEERDERHRWPFLVPVLQRVFQLRHRMAHGIVRGPDVNGGIVVYSWNRGRESRQAYEVAEFRWLAWQADVAALELRQLWAFVVPEDDSWHES